MDGLKKKYGEKVDFETIDVGDYDLYADYQKKYDFQSVPTALVLDGSNKVVLREADVSDEAAFKSRIEKALNEVSDKS